MFWVKFFILSWIQLSIIIINVVVITVHISPGPAMVSSETDQGALEQATGRVFSLQIEGPCTESYYWIRIQN